MARPTRRRGSLGVSAATAPHLDIDLERAGQAIAHIALASAELLRPLRERQAVQRSEAGSLDERAQERVGLGLTNARAAIVDGAANFGLDETDIDFELGPFGSWL